MSTIKAFRFSQMAALGALLIFFPVFLVERGLSLSQVGVITTLPVAIQLLSGMFWGMISDLKGRTKPFLIQALLVWTIYVLLLPRLSGFLAFLLAGMGRALFSPMMEGLIVTTLFHGSRAETRGHIYSGFAIWGSMGWAFGVGVGGLLARNFGTHSTFFFSGALLLASTILAGMILETKEQRSERKDPKFIFSFLKERRVLQFFLATLPIILALNAASQFFPVRLRESGASGSLIGAVYMIPALLEIPVFLRIGKHSDRWGKREPLLYWGSCVYGAVFLLIAAIAKPWGLFLSYSFLEPLAWAPFITGAFTIMAELVPEHSWAFGQTIFSSWMWSVGGTLGPLIAGFIAERLGLKGLFLVLGALALASFVGLKLFSRGGGRPRPHPGSR